QRSDGGGVMRIVLAAATAALAVGCGPSWRVVKQATPNPITAASSFSVAPATWEGVQVGKKSEAEYLADKDENTRRSHEADKTLFAQALQAQVAENGKKLKLGEGGFVVRPNVYWFEPGFYQSLVNADTQIKVRFDVVDPQGQM